MDNKDKNDGVKRMRGRRRYFFSSYVFFKKHKKVRGHKSTGVSFLHLVQKKQEFFFFFNKKQKNEKAEKEYMTIHYVYI